LLRLFEFAIRTKEIVVVEEAIDLYAVEVRERD